MQKNTGTGREKKEKTKKGGAGVLVLHILLTGTVHPAEPGFGGKIGTRFKPGRKTVRAGRRSRCALSDETTKEMLYR